MAETAVASRKETGFENVRARVESIPMSKIRLPKYALRDVNRNTLEFQQLRDSIAASDGPLMSILVREIDDPENPGKTAYGLIDGLQRFSCCQDLGLTEIGARIVDMDDAEIAETQIIANRSRIETKPIEYTNQLHRMLNANPTWTLQDLADKLFVKEAWLRDRLALSKLHEKIGALVDEGKILLSYAYVLAKLRPDTEQLNFVDQAQTQTLQEFTGHVQNRVKELRAATRTGKSAGTQAEYTPVPHIRPLRDIKVQFENPAASIAPTICEKMNAETPVDGFLAGIAWVLNMDPATIEVLKQQDADRKAKTLAAKQAKDAEKLAKKVEEARKAAEAAGIKVPDASSAETDEEDEDDDN